MKELPGSVTLQYSELLQQVDVPAPRGKGISFVTKRRNEKTYLYLQNTVGARKTQHYLGVDSSELREKIEKEKQLWESVKPESDNRKRLVGMLVNGGAYCPDSSSGRVLELMEQAGVFKAGAVLVGSHAFACYGNMLGVIWDSQLTKTQDIDVASDNVIPVVIDNKQVNLSELILRSGLGFFEVPAFDHRNPSTSFQVRGKELRVDLLTPMIGKTSSKPVLLKSFNAPALPVRFLEYLLEDVQPAAVVFGVGIKVNVPSPGRFALHKLVVSQRRPIASILKSQKDLFQAQQLLSYLIENRPGEILLAFDAAKEMSKKFNDQLESGLGKLPLELKEQIKDQL